MNAADLFLYVSSFKRDEEDPKKRYAFTNEKREIVLHPETKRRQKLIAEEKQEFFDYMQERVYKPQSHNDKVFTLAKEIRKEELKKEMYKEEYFIENVFTKASNAIEERYVVATKSVYDLAQEINNMLKFVDDVKLIREILIESELQGDLKSLKSEYFKYNNIK